MTVGFIPNNPNCGEIELPNGTWFTILKHSKVGDVLGRQYTNDTIIATAEQAKQCAEILEDWLPPQSWGSFSLPFNQSRGQEMLKNMIIHFLNECDGFETY